MALSIDYDHLAKTSFKGLMPVPVPDGELEPRERIALLERMFADGQRPKSSAPQRQPLFFYPGLPSRPIYDPTEFAWLTHVQSQVPVFQAELFALERARREDTFHTVWPDFTERGEWAALWLRLYGQEYNANAALAPQTIAALDQVPGLAGWLGFSAMAPKTHVAPHCGVTNAKLRCHVPLELVPGGSRMRVGDRVHSWTEGEVLVFDDTFEHEVWNDSDQRRVLLIFDIYHPELDAEEIAFLTFMESCTVRQSYDQTMKKYRAESSDVAWLYDAH
jgi:aspartate beta-hydroxylase